LNTKLGIRQIEFLFFLIFAIRFVDLFSSLVDASADCW
jgi:hypothetical protein